MTDVLISSFRAYSATLFLSPRAYLYPWHWQKVPPDPVVLPVDERTLDIAWAESVWGTWPPPEVAEAEVRGEVIASLEDRAIITSLRPGDTVRFDSVVVKAGRIHVEGARIVRPS